MRKNDKLTIMNRLSAALLAVLLIIVLGLSSMQTAWAYDAIVLSDEKPKPVAKAAIVYSEDLGKVVYSKNEDMRLNPYSITKLMTAYIVIQNLELGERITIKGTYADPEESQMKLKDGETLTVEQLLQGLIVESGNDAARALAKAVAGSEAKFAALMNEQAAEWGCKNTHFANASGMQDKNHYTTAADYLIIGRKVMENDVLREICISKKVEIPATTKSKKRIYKNHTTLVNVKDSGVLGGKTGYWNEEDCSVVLQYYKKDMRLTVVILGDTEKGRDKDVALLTKAAHNLIPGYVVAKPSVSNQKLWIKGGEYTHIPVYVTERAYAYPTDGSEESISLNYVLKDGLKAPLKKGQKVGHVDVCVDGSVRATHDIVVHKAVKKGWFTSNLYISNRAALGILAGAVLAALAVAVLVVKRRRREATGAEAANRLDCTTQDEESEVE
ncbi:MAG: D-alanyl-D-alanine carboxypeptidase [Firmicutes bacterium]|nr:D-alanyl-D-alanine carboxypeptidase [Bacillota bacterium]